MVSLDGWVCRQSRWRHSEPQTRWRICVTMTTLWQQQDGGCMLLWKRYGNNKMAAMRIMSLILHLQQYSHRLNLFYFLFPHIRMFLWILHWLRFCCTTEYFGWRKSKTLVDVDCYCALNCAFGLALHKLTTTHFAQSSGRNMPLCIPAQRQKINATSKEITVCTQNNENWRIKETFASIHSHVK